MFREVKRAKLISIIVPVYNVRPYVEKCIESLIGQTYPNLEILLVDGGSTDGSGQICDRYAEADDLYVGNRNTAFDVSSD